MYNLTLMTVIFFLTGIITAEPYFKTTYWDVFPTLAAADEAVEQADSNDIETQIRSAVTYFFQAKSENNLEYMKEAESRLRKLLRGNQKRADAQAFYGMAALALAEMITNVTYRVLKFNSGLKALERAQSQDPENIEILYMYLVDIWQVPTIFKDKNETMYKYAQIWLDAYPRVKESLTGSLRTRFEISNSAVLLILAEIENRLGKKEDAKKHFSMVDKKLSDQVPRLDELYKTLEWQLKHLL